MVSYYLDYSINIFHAIKSKADIQVAFFSRDTRWHNNDHEKTMKKQSLEKNIFPLLKLRHHLDYSINIFRAIKSKADIYTRWPPLTETRDILSTVDQFGVFGNNMIQPVVYNHVHVSTNHCVRSTISVQVKYTRFRVSASIKS